MLICRQEAAHSRDAELIEWSLNSVRVFYFLKVFFSKNVTFTFLSCWTRFYRVMLCIRGTIHGPLSVCPSVRHKSVFYRNGSTNRAGFWHVSFLTPVLHCVKRKFGYFQNKGTSLWNFVLNSGVRKFRHGISIVETRYQLSSRKVDAQSVINWAVVGQLSR